MIKKNWQPLVFSLVFAFMWSQIMYRGSFGDEQENMVAGWLINQGYVPYKDFFFHHAPLPFFISAVLQIFRGSGYAIYRTFILSFHLLTFWLSYKLSAKKIRPALFFAYLLIAISSPFLATFQFLADSLSASSLMVLVFLLYGGYKYKRPDFKTFLKVLAGLGVIAVFSSVVYALALILIFGLSLVVYWPEISSQFETEKFKYLKLAIAATALALILPIYFVFNGAFEPFYWSTVVYNQEYYFRDRLAEDGLELKYGVYFRIVRQFFKYFKDKGGDFTKAVATLTQTSASSFKNIVLGQNNLKIGQIFLIVSDVFWMKAGTIEIAVLVVFLGTLFYWLIRNWKIGLAYFVLALAFRARSSEIFHQAPFYFLSFASLGLVLRETLLIKKRFLRVSLGFFGILISVYLSAVLWTNFKQYALWDEPIINSEIKQISTEINQRTEPQDKILIIGGLPTYYMLSKRLPATKYFYYHPWFKRADRIRNSILKTVENKEAALIFYQDLSEGRRYDDLMEETVEQNYQRVETTINDFYGYVPQEN